MLNEVLGISYIILVWRAGKLKINILFTFKWKIFISEVWTYSSYHAEVAFIVIALQIVLKYSVIVKSLYTWNLYGNTQETYIDRGYYYLILLVQLEIAQETIEYDSFIVFSIPETVSEQSVSTLKFPKLELKYELGWKLWSTFTSRMEPGILA